MPTIFGYHLPYILFRSLQGSAFQIEHIYFHFTWVFHIAHIAGFGSLANSVELHVYRSDAERAWKVVEEFEEEMDSEY